MQIIINKKELSQIIKKLSNFKTRYNKIIGFRIEAYEQEIRLIATDKEIFANIKINGTINQEGFLNISIQELQELIKNIDNDLIKIEKQDNDTCIVNDIFNLRIEEDNISPAKEFYNINQCNKVIDIDYDVLSKMVNKVKRFISKDQGRENITGTNFFLKDDKLKLQATDGKTLAESSIEIESTEEIRELIYDFSKIINLFNRGSLEILKTDKFIAFKQGDISLYTRIKRTEADFPPAEKLNFGNNFFEFELDRLKLKNNIIDGREEDYNKSILLKKITENQLEISLPFREGKEDCKKVIECDIQQDFLIKLNSDYLKWAITNLDGDNIRVVYRGQVDPITFESFGDIATKFIICPQKINKQN